MKYSIVFSSKTGNTAQLSNVIKESLPSEDCLYFGTPNEAALAAPLIFVGFWTEKGVCDEATTSFLKSLASKKVFLFGTAGLGGNNEYFKKIIMTAKNNLDISNTVVGDFMCQGKLPAAVLEKYKKKLLDTPDSPHFKAVIENFYNVDLHPNEADFEMLKTALSNL